MHSLLVFTISMFYISSPSPLHLANQPPPSLTHLSVKIFFFKMTNMKSWICPCCNDYRKSQAELGNIYYPTMISGKWQYILSCSDYRKFQAELGNIYYPSMISGKRQYILSCSDYRKSQVELGNIIYYASMISGKWQ